jgi:zinc transporter ZupT
MNTQLAVLTAGLAACGVTGAGIYTISRFEDAARRYSTCFVSFAAGVLITVSFLHLLPRSVELTDSAPACLLAGLFGLYLIDRTLKHRGEPGSGPDTGAGAAVIVGIGLHSLLAGMIFSVTFTAGMMTGTLSAIGMVLHEFPEGVIMFTLLENFGYGRRRAVRIAFLVAGVTTPVGAMASYPFVQHLQPAHLAPLLAASGGALVYVGASHLLPVTLEKGRDATLFYLFAGAAAAALVVFLKHA